MQDNAKTNASEEARLALRRERLAAETHEKRAARLEHMSALQRERLAAESEEERATRLANRNVHSDEHLLHCICYLACDTWV